MNILNKVTLKILRKNKVRTIVTIIGIILSAAMFTAVTTAVSSGMQYLQDVEIYQNGSWHGVFLNLNHDDALQLKSDSQVKTTSTIQNIGFAYLEGSQNEYKPYCILVELKRAERACFRFILRKESFRQMKVKFWCRITWRQMGG